MPEKLSRTRSAKGRSKPIRVGVVGVGRGQSFARGASEAVGMKLVALCDTWQERLEQVGREYSVSTYTDYDRFLEHEMDAVILANYFHQHAPLAIQALDSGRHVMSETATHKTMAEGVSLCRAVEKSGQTYMLAENYPFCAANQEMRRLYQAGKIGKVRYAEGEYNHAIEESERLALAPGEDHWRNWIPPTYYCSHALAPLMYVTDTMPLRVNALSIVEESTQSPRTTRVSDNGCAILVRMDNSAVFRVFGLMLSSAHRTRYEFHGERGLMSTAAPDHWSTVHIHHEEWLREPGIPCDVTYSPDWPEHGELARKSGHGGGDFWTNFYFANAIRSGQPPYLDVYRGTAMCSVGILAWKSALQDGAPFDVPDLQSEEVRKQYENDHWSPLPEDAAPGQPPPSVRGHVKPSSQARKAAHKIWQALH